MGDDDAVARIEKLRIEQIMIPLDRYPTVFPDTKLREAIRVMDEAQLDVGGRKSLPRVLLVVERADRLAGEHGDRLVGHVRRRDVMRGLEPKFLLSQPLDYRKKWFDIQIDPLMSELTTDRVVKAIREQAERPVRDIMLPIKGAIDAGDHVVTALYEMVAYGVPLLPVVRRGRYVGVVRSVEVFHELAQLVI